jgi:hypothetical protein
MAGVTPFSGADSLIGYLYQIRMALLLSLRRLPAGADFVVSVETLDDVTFETKGGTPQELVQTKHHRSREASLADSSSDLWKSMRIWIESIEANRVLAGTTLHLLTTATASEGSAAYKLRSGCRDVAGALSALEATAQTSTNRDNTTAYESFLKMDHARRRAILDSVIVIDGASSITDTDLELRTVVFSAVDRNHLDPFLERLEGWWIRRVLRQLEIPGDRILAEELEAQMADLREQFKQESLPIDEDILDFMLDDVTRAAHANSPFVLQIEIAKASKQRIAAAIRDYYRAFEQRSRWLREDLIYIGEVHQYERRLVEAWDLVFLAMKDEIGDDATAEAQERAARDVLRWAEQSVIPIRPQVTEPFVTRGSLHMLADEQRVGWHPDFRAMLAELLVTHGGNL